MDMDLWQIVTEPEELVMESYNTTYTAESGSYQACVTWIPTLSRMADGTPAEGFEEANAEYYQAVKDGASMTMWSGFRVWARGF